MSDVKVFQRFSVATLKTHDVEDNFVSGSLFVNLWQTVMILLIHQQWIRMLRITRMRNCVTIV